MLACGMAKKPQSRSAKRTHTHRWAKRAATPNAMSHTLRLWLALFLSVAIVEPVFADVRLPAVGRVLNVVKAAGYEAPAEQIPATVIDNGALAFVPYVSFRVGPDREVNVYGDLEDPACIEIGLYRSLLNSEPEKRLALALANLLAPSLDVPKLRLNGDKLLKNGTVAEITLPDAPDAYGGWWISIYSMDKLNAVRGTSSNISTVSESQDAAIMSREWSAEELTKARQPTPSKEPPQRASATSSYSSHTPSVGRVYVRSYVRKDGTYVRAHTRRR